MELILNSKFMCSDVYRQNDLPYYRNVLYLALNTRNPDIADLVFRQDALLVPEMINQENRSCLGNLRTFSRACNLEKVVIDAEKRLGLISKR